MNDKFLCLGSARGETWRRGALSQSSPDSAPRCGTESGETMPRLGALMYVPADTGITLGFGPENFSPWNERELACI